MADFTDIGKWIEYNADYYCGSNVSIFFGGIWVDDIITLQYSASQSKMPLYGYASQQFDAVAEGQFIVQGSFTIAFKEVGYLNLIMERLRSQLTSQGGLSSKEEKDFYNNLMQEKRKKEWQNLGLSSKGFDQSRLDPAQNPLMGFTDDGNRKQPRISRLKIEQVLNAGPGEQEFEDMAEELEDSIWGVSALSERYLKRPDQFEKFDILLSYGNVNAPATDHTLQSLKDVYITGVSQVMMPTGDPIAEQYEFFARGLNEAITSRTIKIKEDEDKANDNIDNTISVSEDAPSEIQVKSKWEFA